MITIERLVKPLMEIKREEWRKTVLTFFYFYLTITAYYILKPARNTLFINYLGANNLPYVYLTIAVISYFLSTMYTRSASRFGAHRVVTYSLLFAITNLLVFRWAFQFEYSWFVPIVSFLFYIWVTLFSVMTVTQFWVLANDVFDARSAKRLYGFVGSGGILGGMTGGFIASYARTLSTENLLLIASGFIVFMIVVYTVIWRNEEIHFLSDKESTYEEKTSRRETLRIVQRSRYLIYILLIVTLMKIVTVQTEWQYNRFVELFVANKDDMTVFFGKVLVNLNIVALIVQLLFTSRILKRFGFNRALIPLPFGLLLGSLSILFFPGVFAASMLKVSEGSLRYSINQTAKEYLYLPIRRHIRYKIKPFIDVCVYQFAKGFGAFFLMGYLWLMISVFKVSPVMQAINISYVIIFLIGGWFFIIWQLKKDYPNQIRHFLKAEKNKADDCALLNTSYIQSFLESMRTDDFSTLHELLVTSQEKGAKVRIAVCIALSEGQKNSSGLKEIIEGLIKAGEKKDVYDLLTASTSIDDINGLIDGLPKKSTASRYATLKALHTLRLSSTPVSFNMHRLEKVLAHEVQEYYKTSAVCAFYETVRHRATPCAPDADLLHVALLNMLHETVGRIFYILGLLYNPLDMNMIYEALHKSNNYIRANALELLDELLDNKQTKGMIFPLLDGELSFFGLQEVSYLRSKTVYTTDTLKRTLESDDSWLIVCALFMVLRCHIEELYDEVETLKEHSDEVVQKTAHFVMQCIIPLKEKTS